MDGWHRVVIVHGGGPQASALQKTLGLETRMIAGRRYTDAATLDVMKYVLAGQLNVDLCARLLARGVMPVGLHGASGHMVQAVRRPPRVMQGAGPDPVDLGPGRRRDRLQPGAAGRPLRAALRAGHRLPRLRPEAGRCSTSTATRWRASWPGALKADALVLVTSTPGVLRDVKDPSSRLPRIGREAEFERLVKDGTISGGMIPKLEESFAILAGGAQSVVIIGKLGPGDLARAVLEPGSAGTVLEP